MELNVIDNFIEEANCILAGPEITENQVEELPESSTPELGSIQGSGVLGTGECHVGYHHQSMMRVTPSVGDD